VSDPAHRRSVLLLVGAALCWSLAGVLFKYVEWPGLAAAAGRGLISAAFLAAISWRSLRFTWSPLQIGGAVAYAACTVLFALANKMTTAANAILLQYTAPVWVALLASWLLGERATRADWITIAVALGGMALFFYEGLQLRNLGGILVAVASGVAFAVMTVLMRMQKDTSTVESIILGNLIGVAIGFPALLSAGPLPASGWVALALLGVVQLGFAYLLYSRAIKHVTALEAVLIPVLEPILNPLWVLLAKGEKLSLYTLAGGTIVLVAVTLRAAAGLRRAAAPPS